MKAIIYAGMCLFSAASIYGVADYYNSGKKGTLKNLYKEVPAAKQEISFGASEERDIMLKDYSRGRIDEPVDEKKIEAINGQIIERNNTLSLKKKNAKRKVPKIKFSDFSRSALVREMPPAAVTDSSTEKY